MQENVAACAPLPSQYAAIAAYSERKNNEELCNIFKERCSFFIRILACPHGTCQVSISDFNQLNGLRATKFNANIEVLEIVD